MRPKYAWFLAFAAVFAALAGYVFWGTWSLDFAPVMPDDTVAHPMAYGDYVDRALRDFLTNGQLLPSDLLWKGLLFSPYFCQELKYASALFFSACGMAFFLRGRGLSRLASYGAGLLLAFCGYWCTLFSAGHGGWFLAITYVVFDFGLADRAVRTNLLRHWLLLGLCVGWSLLCQADFCFILSLLAGAYFAWCCVRERKLPWKGALAALAVCAAVGTPGVLGALGSKEFREQQIAKGETVAPGAAKDGSDARWIFVTNWSLPTDETAEFLVPRLNGDTSCPLTLSIGMRHGTGIKPYTGALGRPKDAPSGNYRQHSLYVGWVTCVLALFGCVWGLRRLRGSRGSEDEHLSSDVPFFVGAAVFFWLLSLGRNFEPLYRIVFALPVGDSMRAPVKWHHLTELSLAVLAGYGIEALLRRLPSTVCRLPSVALVGAIVLFGAFDLARVDRFYCAPVDLRQVRKTNSDMKMSVLRRQDFANPQVAEMVRRGQVVSLANYLGNPDLYLVEVLTPRKPSVPRKPLPPMTTAGWLGVLSAVSALAVVAYLVKSKVTR